MAKRKTHRASSSVDSKLVSGAAPYGLNALDRDDLIETGGRYRDLQLWADARGLTLVQAQQRWHALGLSVVRGGGHD